MVRMFWKIIWLFLPLNCKKLCIILKMHYKSPLKASMIFSCLEKIFGETWMFFSVITLVSQQFDSSWKDLVYAKLRRRKSIKVTVRSYHRSIMIFFWENCSQNIFHNPVILNRKRKQASYPIATFRMVCRRFSVPNFKLLVPEPFNRKTAEKWTGVDFKSRYISYLRRVLLRGRISDAGFLQFPC